MGVSTTGRDYAPERRGQGRAKPKRRGLCWGWGAGMECGSQVWVLMGCPAPETLAFSAEGAGALQLSGSRGAADPLAAAAASKGAPAPLHEGTERGGGSTQELGTHLWGSPTPGLISPGRSGWSEGYGEAKNMLLQVRRLSFSAPLLSLCLCNLLLWGQGRDSVSLRAGANEASCLPRKKLPPKTSRLPLLPEPLGDPCHQVGVSEPICSLSAALCPEKF